jgi:hypothetical protein
MKKFSMRPLPHNHHTTKARTTTNPTTEATPHRNHFKSRRHNGRFGGSTGFWATSNGVSTPRS